VRTLCPSCSEPYEPFSEIVEKFALGLLAGGRPIVLRRAKGCDACGGTGYRGRSSILEVLRMTDEIRQAVLKSADASRLHALAVESGMQTMQQHGLRKALAGSTSLEEVLRVTRTV
jgi:general secretion pathway protein E